MSSAVAGRRPQSPPLTSRPLRGIMTFRRMWGTPSLHRPMKKSPMRTAAWASARRFLLRAGDTVAKTCPKVSALASALVSPREHRTCGGLGAASLDTPSTRTSTTASPTSASSLRTGLTESPTWSCSRSGRHRQWRWQRELAVRATVMGARSVSRGWRYSRRALLAGSSVVGWMGAASPRRAAPATRLEGTGAASTPTRHGRRPHQRQRGGTPSTRPSSSWERRRQR
mmetsp:Transcript_55222/g.165452  ORF Transcript_55222/g.165452 Transcript_55222/m.165452 type:complete len:227 (+) Transcript_55222:2563-3243(+)